MRSSLGRLAFVGAAFVTVPVGYYLLTASRIRRAERAGSPGSAGQKPPSDLIVVLGAAVEPRGPSAELKARLDYARELWQAGRAPTIALSGGVTAEADEPRVMKEYLLEQDVPEDVLIELHGGETTRATIESLSRIGRPRTIAVSSPYHCYRIVSEARRQGIIVSPDCPAHTPETDGRAVHRAMVATEVLACFWYSLPGLITERVDTGPGTLRHSIPWVLQGRRPPDPVATNGAGRDPVP